MPEDAHNSLSANGQTPRGTAAPGRVLVIDDDPKILAVSRELLTQHGYDVTACADSAQALALVKASAYDVVLTDIRMPGLEGTDLLPMLKRLRPSLPVILVSAYCEPEHIGYYQSLGACDMIAKPFSHERLLNAVARVVGQHETIPLTLTNLRMRDARDHLYRKLILIALQKTGWNQTKASELLGLSRYGLIRWMKRLGVVSQALHEPRKGESR